MGPTAGRIVTAYGRKKSLDRISIFMQKRKGKINTEYNFLSGHPLLGMLHLSSIREKGHIPARVWVVSAPPGAVPVAGVVLVVSAPPGAVPVVNTVLVARTGYLVADSEYISRYGRRLERYQHQST